MAAPTLTETEFSPHLNTRTSVLRQWRWLAFGLFLIALLARNIISINQNTPFIDEALYTSHAWGILQNGRPFGPMQTGVLDIFERHWAYYPWLIAWIQAAAIALMGFGLVSVRAVSLLFAGVLLVAIYGIGNKVGGTKTAMYAVVLVALSSSFNVSAQLARPDIIVAAIGFGAIALYLGDTRHQRWPGRSLVSGLMIAATFEIHPNIAIFVPVIALLYWIDYRWTIFRRPHFWTFISTASLGPALYFLLHFYSNQHTFHMINYITLGSSKTPPIFEMDKLLSSVAGTIMLVIYNFPIAFPVVLFAAIMQLSFKDRSHRILSVIFFVILIEYIAIIPYKPFYYEIFLITACSLSVAQLLSSFSAQKRSFPRAIYRPTVIISWTLLISSLGISVLLTMPIRSNNLAKYQTTVDRVRQVVPPSQRLLADERYWFGFANSPFTGWYQVFYYRRYDPSKSVLESMHWLKVDYLIVDKHIDWFYRDDLEPWAAIHRIDRSEMEDFLQQHTELVAEIETDLEQYGTLRLYRLTTPPG